MRNDIWLPARKKREIRAKVRAEKPESMTATRRTRRRVRRSIGDGSFNDLGLNIPKPGRFVSDAFQSSGRFRSAYSYARSEAEFYDMARYEDY